MTEVIIAAVLWGLVISMAISWHRGKSVVTLGATVLCASSLTLNISPLYQAVDREVGGRNLTDLIANLMLLVSLYLLCRAVVLAVRSSPTHGSVLLPELLLLVVVLLAVTVAFFFIEAPESSTRFMADYGAQPAAAIYSSIQFIYIGNVMARAGFACFVHRSIMRTKVFSLGFTVVGIGCVLSILVVIDVLAMNISHLLGARFILSVLSSIYPLVYLAAIVFLCVGLAIPPIGRWRSRVKNRVERQLLLREALLIWERMMGGTESEVLSQLVVGNNLEDPDARLHRISVEIRDIAQTRSVASALTAADEELLVRLETYLRPLGRRGHAIAAGGP
ncbi:MAG: hypothetical protein ACRCSP_04145 [Rhodoglobus sp.]